VRALSWYEVDFAGVVIAGLIGGYVMAIVGLWAGRVPGLTAFDISDFGRRYMASDSPIAWIVGMVSHLINSILLVFTWASLICSNLDFARNLPSLSRVISGLAWGEFLAFTLSGALVAPMSGLGVFGRKTGSYKMGLTSVVMHGVWGLLIGLTYAPK
jgi:hypothetical protein